MRIDIHTYIQNRLQCPRLSFGGEGNTDTPTLIYGINTISTYVYTYVQNPDRIQIHTSVVNHQQQNK